MGWNRQGGVALQEQQPREIELRLNVLMCHRRGLVRNNEKMARNIAT